MSFNDFVVLSVAAYPEPGQNPRVKAVKPNPDYTITLLFTNGETRSFDVRPHLDRGIFRELRDLRNFNSVKPFLGSVQWQNGQDFCPDTLYADSVPVSSFEGRLRTRQPDPA